MRWGQTRRQLLTSLSDAGAAGALGLVGGRQVLATEAPPEVITIRIRVEDTPPSWIGGVADDATCTDSLLVTEDLLRAEGFTDIRYVRVKNGSPYAQAFTRGEIDFGLRFAPGAAHWLDTGVPITVLAGVHPGCFGLFAHEPIRTVTDLKGKRVGIEDGLGSASHLYVSMMAAHVGLDPQKDIKWVTPDDVPNQMELFVQGKIDGFLAFVTEFPELRARKIGRMIVDMALDQPWSQYFCCIAVGHSDFVRRYPVATKRALRAILKATDMCATEPQRAARKLVEAGFAQHYDIVLQMLTELPYNAWRELDPEDSMRFYALWMHEFGQLKATPNALIAAGTDWRFLNEIKRELKA
jgi:NitT/TauT family transport system substrate-binding protein